MSASDYGYASSTHTAALSAYNTLALTSINWLYGKGCEWTLTAPSGPSNSIYALYVADSGSVYFSSSPEIGYAVRPVLYLKNSVYVVSGDGTEANPYQIGMG